MQKTHAAISAGQHVVVRDERWTVLHTENFDSTQLLRLRGVDYDNRDHIQSILAPFESIRAEGSSRLRRRSRRGVLGAAARAVADALPWDVCWTAAHARIDLHDWQMAPAQAAVTGTTRILLADDVGLGKTVQAALIIAELLARGLATRVLILTPAAIRTQWSAELEQRFGLTATVFDQASLATMATALPPDINPWRTTPLIISSIDLVKRPEVRAAVDDVAFDILVVDEAHHITPATDRGALVDDLARRTPWIVLATATPHSGDDRAYDFLTGLGGGNEPIAVFRRSIRLHSRPRRSLLLLVTPTAAERELLTETWHYARALAKTRADHARLAGGVIARRAASSAAAAARTLARRLALLTQQPVPVAEPTLPWDDVDTLDDDVADSTIAAAGLKDATAEIAWLRRLVDLATLASGDWSKQSVIHRLLRRTRESLLVFSEYRDVVRQLATSLEATTSVVMLHGGMSPRERALAIDLFNTGRARVLVATDAAGEGLNLHLQCRTVVNVELPWTPLRHEQRIGRVDRIGQTRRVHAISLAHRASYEELVIARLERRRRRAAVVIGELATASPVRTGNDDVSTVRRLTRLGGGNERREAGAVYCITRRPHSRLPIGHATFLVFLLPVLDSSGRLLCREVVFTRILTGARLTRSHLRRLTRDRGVESTLAAEAGRRVAIAQGQFDAISARLATRIRALTTHVNDSAASRLWQDSLFDRREERQARRRAASIAALSEHLTRRLDTVLDLRGVRAGTPQLVAAWQGEPSCFLASAGR